MINSAVSGGITLIKDITPAKTSKSAEDQLAYLSVQLKNSWKDANAGSLAKIFDGSQTSFENFVNLADQGGLIDDLSGYINDTAKPFIQTALWGTLIPWAWSLSNDEHHPLVM